MGAMVRKAALLAVVLVLTMVGSVVTAAVVAQEQQEAGNQADGAVDAQTQSHLRIAHAAVDAPAVDVAVDNETVASNVSFGDVSGYLDVSAGDHNVSVTPAADEDDAGDADPVLEATVTLDARSVNTLVVHEPADATGTTELETVLFEDDARTPGEDDAAVRAVHLVPDGPEVNVTVTSGEAMADGADGADNATGADGAADNATAGADNATGAQSQTVVLASSLPFNASSDYVTVPAGDEVTIAVGDDTVAGDQTILTTTTSLAGESAYTVWILPAEGDGDDGAAGAQAAVTPDATFTLELPENVSETPETDTETATPAGENETETPETDTETETPEDEGETETTEGEDETETPGEADGTETPGEEAEGETPDDEDADDAAGTNETE